MTQKLPDILFNYLLGKKAVDTKALLTEPICRGYTKQGIYKALRTLRDEEKILWSKRGQVEVHLLWIQQEIDRLAATLPHPELVFTQFGATPVTYKALTLSELERLYGQVFISLISALQGKVKNYLFYDIHNYTYVSTTMIVDWYIDYIKRNNGEVYLLVGSMSPLDLALKKRNKMKEIHIHCISPRWPTALSIFGEYIITIRFNKKILKAFEEIFALDSPEQAESLIKELYSQKYPSSITVEKNPEKAVRLSKVFGKYFFLK